MINVVTLLVLHCSSGEGNTINSPYSWLQGFIDNSGFTGANLDKPFQNTDYLSEQQPSSFKNGVDQEDSIRVEDSGYPDTRDSAGDQTYNMEGSEIGDATYVIPDNPRGLQFTIPAYEPPRRSYAFTVNDGKVIHNDIRKDNGEYIFSYKSADGSMRREIGSLETNKSGQKVLTVRGSYDYTTPDGQKYGVHYQADTNGYRILSNKPIGDNYSTTTPVTVGTGSWPVTGSNSRPGTVSSVSVDHSLNTPVTGGTVSRPVTSSNRRPGTVSSVSVDHSLNIPVTGGTVSRPVTSSNSRPGTISSVSVDHSLNTPVTVGTGPLPVTGSNSRPGTVSSVSVHHSLNIPVTGGTDSRPVASSNSRPGSVTSGTPLPSIGNRPMPNNVRPMTSAKRPKVPVIPPKHAISKPLTPKPVEISADTSSNFKPNEDNKLPSINITVVSHPNSGKPIIKPHRKKRPLNTPVFPLHFKFPTEDSITQSEFIVDPNLYGL